MTLFVTIGIGSLISLARVSNWNRLTVRERLTLDPTTVSLRGVLLAQLAIGVLGVLVITAEYGTGLIRSTFVAVPQRRLVLGAKVAVFAVAAFVVALVACLAAFEIGQAIFATKRAGISLADPGAARAVVGAACYLTAVGVMGLGLGTLLRRTAGGIATLFGIVLALPLLTNALPSPWDINVGKYLPSGAGLALFTIHHPFGPSSPSSDVLHPLAGLAVLVGYVAATLALAAFMITRRDA